MEAHLKAVYYSKYMVTSVMLWQDPVSGFDATGVHATYIDNENSTGLEVLLLITKFFNNLTGYKRAF